MAKTTPKKGKATATKAKASPKSPAPRRSPRKTTVQTAKKIADEIASASSKIIKKTASPTKKARPKALPAKVVKRASPTKTAAGSAKKATAKKTAGTKSPSPKKATSPAKQTASASPPKSRGRPRKDATPKAATSSTPAKGRVAKSPRASVKGAATTIKILNSLPAEELSMLDALARRTESPPNKSPAKIGTIQATILSHYPNAGALFTRLDENEEQVVRSLSVDVVQGLKVKDTTPSEYMSAVAKGLLLLRVCDILESQEMPNTWRARYLTRMQFDWERATGLNANRILTEPGMFERVAKMITDGSPRSTVSAVNNRLAMSAFDPSLPFISGRVFGVQPSIEDAAPEARGRGRPKSPNKGAPKGLSRSPSKESTTRRARSSSARSTGSNRPVAARTRSKSPSKSPVKGYAPSGADWTPSWFKPASTGYSTTSPAHKGKPSGTSAMIEPGYRYSPVSQLIDPDKPSPCSPAYTTNNLSGLQYTRPYSGVGPANGSHYPGNAMYSLTTTSGSQTATTRGRPKSPTKSGSTKARSVSWSSRGNGKRLSSGVNGSTNSTKKPSASPKKADPPSPRKGRSRNPSVSSNTGSKTRSTSVGSSKSATRARSKSPAKKDGKKTSNATAETGRDHSDEDLEGTSTPRLRGKSRTRSESSSRAPIQVQKPRSRQGSTALQDSPTKAPAGTQKTRSRQGSVAQEEHGTQTNAQSGNRKPSQDRGKSPQRRLSLTAFESKFNAQDPYGKTLRQIESEAYRAARRGKQPPSDRDDLVTPEDEASARKRGIERAALEVGLNATEDKEKHGDRAKLAQLALGKLHGSGECTLSDRRPPKRKPSQDLQSPNKRGPVSNTQPREQPPINPSPKPLQVPKQRGKSANRGTGTKPLTPGRGTHVSFANPEYIPGTIEKNPFFETMPAPEVWHRRMPPYFPFGETPFMEKVISRQINEDLAKGREQMEGGRKASSSLVDWATSGVKSLFTSSQQPKERVYRPPWELPEVSDEQVQKCLSSVNRA